MSKLKDLSKKALDSTSWADKTVAGVQGLSGIAGAFGDASRVRDTSNYQNEIDSLANTTNAHTNAPSIAAVNGGLDEVKDDIDNYWETIYPVGSIYMSVSGTSPATLFGGTWEQIQERFLLSAV